VIRCDEPNSNRISQPSRSPDRQYLASCNPRAETNRMWTHIWEWQSSLKLVSVRVFVHLMDWILFPNTSAWRFTRSCIHLLALHWEYDRPVTEVSLGIKPSQPVVCNLAFTENHLVTSPACQYPDSSLKRRLVWGISNSRPKRQPSAGNPQLVLGRTVE